jgi:hypothetical protein
MGQVRRIADLIDVHRRSPHALQSPTSMSNSQMLNNGQVAMMVEGSGCGVDKSDDDGQDQAGMGALPKMKQPATYMQAHFHSIQAATKHPRKPEIPQFMNTRSTRR